MATTGPQELPETEETADTMTVEERLTAIEAEVKRLAAAVEAIAAKAR